MCTVSLLTLPGPDGELIRRMCCSRDESPTRPWSPPAMHAFFGHQTLMPVDDVAGGTWVAVSETGLAGTLLNRTLPGLPSGTGPRSRGGVLTELLGARTVAEAAAHLADMDLQGMGGFRLVMHDDKELLMATWHQETQLQTSTIALTPGQAHVWCSSGLGDHLVDPPRRALFDSAVVAVDVDQRAEAQDAFHRTTWPDEPHLAPAMVRDGACTSSLTLIQVDSTQMHMTLWDDVPTFTNVVASLSLPRIEMEEEVDDAPAVDDPDDL